MFNIEMTKQVDPSIYPLLLLADPDLQKIEQYLSSGITFILNVEIESRTKSIGVAVVTKKGAQSYEIENIAIDRQWQGKGLGTQLIYAIERFVKGKQAKSLWVATGNSSINQLAFYQRVGFRFEAIDKDYFSQHYSESIVENGIPCVDRIILVKPIGLD